MVVVMLLFVEHSIPVLLLFVTETLMKEKRNYSPLCTFAKEQNNTTVLATGITE
jgi:hypothetical protein